MVIDIEDLLIIETNNQNNYIDTETHDIIAMNRNVLRLLFFSIFT